MKVQIKGWIVRHQPSYAKEPTWIFDQWGKPPKTDDDQVPVRQYTLEVEVPDGDFISERVTGIREEIKRTYARAEETVRGLREQEATLLCITNEVKV